MNTAPTASPPSRPGPGPGALRPDRLRALAGAYGADPRRWPEAERAAAVALAAQGDPAVQEALAEAAELDGWLAHYTVPPPSAAVLQRATSPAATPRGPRGAWWWPGAGLAGAGLAGALAGTLAVSVALDRGAPLPEASSAGNWPERASAFSELSADWSEP